MPSQFQPYYPRAPQPAVTQSGGKAAGGQQAGNSLDKLLQAIGKQRAANAISASPDDLGTLGDEGLIAQINQSPSAIDSLGTLGDESLIGSYY